MNITDAGLRGYNPKGVVIHNDAGSDYATVNYYRNWLPTYPKEKGFAHVYMSDTDRLQATDFSYKAWHCANSYGNANYASWEVIQSSGDLAQFLRNEQAVLDDVAKYMKLWGLTPNRDTVKLHQELSATSCPARSFSLHGNTLEACRDYFIKELQKRLGGSNNTSSNDKPKTTQPQKEEEEIKMYLIQGLDNTTKQPKHWYVSDGVSIRHINTNRFLENYRNKYGKLNLKIDSVLLKEIEAEFGIKIKDNGSF